MVKNKTKTTVAQTRAAVQARLRRGDVATIAALTGYDPSHVSRVIHGLRENSEILKRAHSLVGRRKVA